MVTDVGRKLTREIELGGYRIPAGALVMPAITAIHFREDLYPDPTSSARSASSKGRLSHYTWIPFGGGVRRCIGASFAQFEMRVIIRTILERAQLRAADRPAGAIEATQRHRGPGTRMPGRARVARARRGSYAAASIPAAIIIAARSCASYAARSAVTTSGWSAVAGSGCSTSSARTARPSGSPPTTSANAPSRPRAPAPPRRTPRSPCPA